LIYLHGNPPKNSHSLSPFVEQLRNSGFVKNNKPCLEAILRVHPKAILDFVEESIACSQIDKESALNGLFNHTAFGFAQRRDYPCSSIQCRLEKLSELFQFAAFYSDVVYVRNPFSDGYIHLRNDGNLDVETLRSKFEEDLALALANGSLRCGGA
jgi:hypothetical protein